MCKLRVAKLTPKAAFVVEQIETTSTDGVVAILDGKAGYMRLNPESLEVGQVLDFPNLRIAGIEKSTTATTESGEPVSWLIPELVN